MQLDTISKSSQSQLQELQHEIMNLNSELTHFKHHTKSMTVPPYVPPNDLMAISQQTNGVELSILKFPIAPINDRRLVKVAHIDKVQSRPKSWINSYPVQLLSSVFFAQKPSSVRDIPLKNSITKLVLPTDSSIRDKPNVFHV